MHFTQRLLNFLVLVLESGNDVLVFIIILLSTLRRLFSELLELHRQLLTFLLSLSMLTELLRESLVGFHFPLLKLGQLLSLRAQLILLLGQLGLLVLDSQAFLLNGTLGILNLLQQNALHAQLQGDHPPVLALELAGCSLMDLFFLSLIFQQSLQLRLILASLCLQ